VNPQLEEKALVMVFNPLDQAAEKTLSVPLYYAGVKDRVRVSGEDGVAHELPLDSAGRLTLPVTLGPQGVTWFVVKTSR
jgi:hypothetical protein